MKHNQDGSINVLLIPFILVIILLLGAAGFAAWAFSGRQDYKNNTDQKVAVAVSAAKLQEESTLNASFAQQEQAPLLTYNGPEADGSLVLEYPKNWSAYIDDTGASGALVNGYFDPGVIPSLSASTTTYALRVQIVNSPYSGVVGQFANTAGTTVTPYKLAKVPSVIGIEVSGDIGNGATGTEVVFPVRSETLEVWTQNTQFLSDFNDDILPNLSFSP